MLHISISKAKGTVTIDNEEWIVCNKGSKAFCMCRHRPSYPFRSDMHTLSTVATCKAIEKAYINHVFADPFALVDGCSFSDKCLKLRRIFE